MLFRSGVVITDTFAPVLNNLTAALNGTAWTAATDYTYNEATGTFSSTAGAITVPAATYTQDSTTLSDLIRFLRRNLARLEGLAELISDHFIMNLSAGIGKIRIARKQKFVVSGFGRTGVG